MCCPTSRGRRQPDPATRERREVFSAYQGVVKESTRAKQQIKSMLNEHCLRLPKGFRLSHPSALTRLLKLRPWSEVQQLLLSQLHCALVGARQRRQPIIGHARIVQRQSTELFQANEMNEACVRYGRRVQTERED